MDKMDKALVTVVICIAIVACSVVASFAIYNINDRNNMAKNIDAAISKGVDPISVKCAYEVSPTSTCIAYSMAMGRK